MKKSIKIALSATALIALGAIATTAYAHKQGMRHGGGMYGGMHGGMQGKHGGWGKHHGMRQRARHMLERYDANKDGKLSQEEINSNREAWLKEFDADGNGQLSLDEFKQLFLKARAARIVREFQQFDTDGSSGVTLEEYQSPLADLVETHDSNGDGVLGREDMRGHGMRGGMGMRGGAGMMDEDENTSSDETPPANDSDNN